MLKLFAVYVGGEHAQANIEIHDVRFVVASSIEETYPELRRQWWGVPRSLHVDCWAEVTQADGHSISLRPEPSKDEAKLYFVNLGGYEAGECAERHRNVFVVAESPAKAKYRALKLVKSWLEPHKDDLYEAEHVFCLTERLAGDKLFIHLTPENNAGEPVFTCRYMPIRNAT